MLGSSLALFIQEICMSEVLVESIVSLTSPAVGHLREVIAKEDLGVDAMVRFGVSEGGCSGLSYTMKFDSGSQADDHVWNQDGLQICVDDAAAEHLRGVTVDYVQSLTSSGFRFVNPNAERTCGCGTSFS
jgi:iron-sulfur cluster assembly protein